MVVAQRSARRRIGVHIGVNVLATMVQAVSQVALAVAIGHQLGRAGLGSYAWASAIAGPVLLFGNMHLRSVQATDVGGEHPFRHYLQARFVSVVLCVLVLWAIAWVFRDRPGVGVLGAMAVMRGIEAIADVFQGEWQRRTCQAWCGMSVMLRVGLATLVSVSLVSTGFALEVAILGGAAVSFGVFLLHDLPATRHVFKRHPLPLTTGHQPSIRRLIIDTFPLGISVAAGMWAVSVPKLVLEATAGVAALGVFAALMNVVELGAQALRAITQVVMPTMSAHFARQDYRAYYRLVWACIAVAGALAVAGVIGSLLVGGFVLTRVYGPEFSGQGMHLAMAFGAAFFIYASTVLGVAVTAQRQFTRLVVPYVLSALVATGLSLVVIPQWGLAGALWVLAGIGLTKGIAAMYSGIARKTRKVPDGSTAQ